MPGLPCACLGMRCWPACVLRPGGAALPGIKCAVGGPVRGLTVAYLCSGQRRTPGLDVAQSQTVSWLLCLLRPTCPAVCAVLCCAQVW